MTTRSLIRVFLLGAIALVCGTTTANAQLVGGESILLDFGNQGDVGGVVLPANTNQVDSTNAITGLIELGSSRDTAVGLAITSIGTRTPFFNDDSGDLGSPNGNTGTGAPIPAPFNSAILEDWSGVVNQDYSIEFTGLDDSLTYDIVYALGGWTNNAFTDDTAINVDGQSATIGVASVDPRFFTFTGLSTDGSGNLLIELVQAPGPNTNVPVISGLSLTAVGGQGFLLGDVNQDGTVDFLDISPFITLLSSSQFQLEADINEDGSVDFLDISPFIGLLSS